MSDLLAAAMPDETFAYPASFAQQRLWFLDQLQPGNLAYNIPAAIRLTGALNEEALRRSLDEIVRHHESLRTTFLAPHGRPVQVVHPHEAGTLITVDMTRIPEAEREAAAVTRAVEEGRRPFDLARGPLLRASLLRLGDELNYLLLNMHHIVSDGWSVAVLLRQMTELYDAFAHGRHSPLPEPEIQYADYTIWQLERLQGQVLDDLLTYWRRQLRDPLPQLQVPTDHPRPAVQAHRGALLSRTLAPHLVRDLRVVSQREGVTLYMTLLAAIETLFHRTTGQEEIVLGTPVANRDRQELHDLIGLFMNTLVLRTDLGGNPRFVDLLARARDVALEAYSHQELPFEKLVEEIDPPRDRGRNPLFQVLFSFQHAPRGVLELPDLTWAPLELDIGTSKLDLTISTEESGEGLKVVWEYDTDLFQEETVRRMSRQLEALLSAVVADPTQRLDRLALQSDEERHLLLITRNDTRRPVPDLAVHELIAQQAARVPDRVAVSCGNELVTYRELERRAHQLALRLRGLGVGPDVPVGICLDRSIAMVVGLLGILEASGAYVPLDPDLPEDRLSFMIDDTQLGVLVTDSARLPSLPTRDWSVVLLDRPAVSEPCGSPLPPPHPEHLAYVLYTSGSTGRPKGVQVPHRALVNLLRSMRHEPGLDEDDVLLAVTPFSFDIAYLELFLPLIVGARLVLAPSGTTRDGRRLLELVRSCRATVMQATPSSWRMLLLAGWADDGHPAGPPLKILCGGEALARDLADRLATRSSSVWNLYGPTETTIWSTTQEIRRDQGTVPIGRPIANTQVYVLDDSLQPVPMGSVGELYLGGMGLARGYLNRPELTAERFIADPIGSIRSARLYRTGDQVRWRSDGALEYLGRLDQQVKIQGFRIELEEIESVLLQHPAVRETAVVARPGAHGSQTLVAFVVAAAGHAPTPEELRAYLASKLPSYMVPSHLVPIAQLPLTPNRKVDREALLHVSIQQPQRTRASEPPRTALEARLARLYAEVLSLGEVDRLDNFFDLGGTSLQIVEITLRAREIGLDIEPALVFEHQTIAELASALETEDRHGGAIDSRGTPDHREPRRLPAPESREHG